MDPLQFFLSCQILFFFFKKIWKPQFNYINNLVKGKIKSYLIWHQRMLDQNNLRTPIYIYKILYPLLFGRNLVKHCIYLSVQGWILDLSQEGGWAQTLPCEFREHWPTGMVVTASPLPPSLP